MACPRCLEPISGDFAYSPLTTKTCQVAEGRVSCQWHANDVNTCGCSTPHDPPASTSISPWRTVGQGSYSSTYFNWRRLHEQMGNEHTAVVCDDVQYLTNCGEIDILSDKDLSSSNWYVSGQKPDQLQLQKHLTSWAVEGGKLYECHLWNSCTSHNK